MGIEQLREEIDSLDEQILKSLAKRMGLSLEAAKAKREKGLALKQPARESQLVAKRGELASQLGLSQAFVEGLWRQILDESLRVQKED